jgi:hypothetical protein
MIEPLRGTAIKGGLKYRFNSYVQQLLINRNKKEPPCWGGSGIFK